MSPREETTSHEGEAIAPAAEAVVQLLASSEDSGIKRVSTPLTGRNRSARYGGKRRLVAPRSKTSARPAPACKHCGGSLPRRDRTYCDECLPHYQREQYAKGVPRLRSLRDREEEGQWGGSDARCDRSRSTRRNEHRAQTSSAGVGRAAWKARRPLRLPARHPPAHPGRAAQPAAAGDRFVAPLCVADSAR